MTTVEERPVTLAQVPSAAPDAAPLMRAVAGEYLTFGLGGESYGVAILHVQEIRGYAEATRVAGAPACVKGVINLRGQIVPIVDARVLVGIDHPVFDAVTATIVLALGRRLVGIVVDAVADVLWIDGAAIKPAPQLGASGGDANITGIASVGENEAARLLILVDVARMLADAGLGQDLPLAA